MSAGADLLGRVLSLQFGGATQINCPGIALPVADFVGEGAPIPVQKATTSTGSTLSPFKLAVITSLTREMLESANATDRRQQTNRRSRTNHAHGIADRLAGALVVSNRLRRAAPAMANHLGAT
jgi:hypothetical protein